MEHHRNNQGLTLIELLVVMAIVAILATIAIPIYRSFVVEAKVHVALQNTEPLRLALEDHFLDNRTYVAGDWSATGAQTLETGALGWRPDGDGNQLIYNVVAGGPGIGASYVMTVTSIDGEASVQCTRDQDAGTYDCIEL